MASSSLRKVLRTQSLRIFSQYQKPLPLLANRIPKLSDPKPECPNPRPSVNSQFYPTFSFGLFLNPNLPPSLIRHEEELDEAAIPEEDDSRTIRADSVKKKRKKKMNKHKLKKLRKRLRRKT